MVVLKQLLHGDLVPKLLKPTLLSLLVPIVIPIGDTSKALQILATGEI